MALNIGRWATEWIAHLSFASPPQVTGLHVVTTACFFLLPDLTLTATQKSDKVCRQGSRLGFASHP